jgi:hypothetical protein
LEILSWSLENPEVYLEEAKVKVFLLLNLLKHYKWRAGEDA